MKKPFVSIITATYNMAEILTTRTIPSVLDQTFQNFEIIVVLDDCTDDTRNRLERMQDSRIKIVEFTKGFEYSTNKQIKWFTAGVPPMNKGLELAKGDLIAHLDHDDVFFPNHLEIAVKHHVDNPNCDVTYSLAENIYIGDQSRSGICGQPDAKIIPHCTVVTKEKHRSFKYSMEGKKAADKDRWERMLKANLRFDFIDQVTTRHWTKQKIQLKPGHPCVPWWYGDQC